MTSGADPMKTRQDRRIKPTRFLSFDAVEQRLLCSLNVIVPGTANPYLANPANKSGPAEATDGTSPPSIVVTGETSLTFGVTGGTTNNLGVRPIEPPDGGASVSAYYGARGGISSWDLPIDMLAGVFLGNTIGSAPSPYTGSDTASTIAPKLGQVFPIGDGLTGHGSGSVQDFTVPSGATHLYLVDIDGFKWSDNGGQLNVTVDPLSSDIVMDEATTTDSKTATAIYDINAASITQPLTFNIYRSASQTSYSSADLIGSDTLSATDTADLSIGHHQVKLNVASGILLPDASHEFVTVVANPGKTIQEQSYANDTSYFQVFVLGAISHGLMDPFDGSPSGVIPTWESTMAATLKASTNNGGEGYNDVIPFNWTTTSNTPLPGEAVAAGQQLANVIATEATQFESQHIGNVVDLDLIGHSRGTVVVSQAVQDLVNQTPAIIRGSYISLNLLDPHPAANFSTFGNYASTSGGVAGTTAAAALFAAQALYRDPPIVVPSVVNSVRVYFQQTPADLFPYTGIDSQGNINLWGHGNDRTITNQSSTSIKYINLTQ
jgi:hypothetical protein